MTKLLIFNFLGPHSTSTSRSWPSSFPPAFTTASPSWPTTTSSSSCTASRPSTSPESWSVSCSSSRRSCASSEASPSRPRCPPTWSIWKEAVRFYCLKFTVGSRYRAVWVRLGVLSFFIWLFWSHNETPLY